MPLCNIRYCGFPLERSILYQYNRIGQGRIFIDKIMSPHSCVDSRGETRYAGDDSCTLRWGDLRAR